MGSIFKVLIFTSPVLALLFYYAVVQQNKLDAQMQKENAAFERSWNEFDARFTGDKDAKKKYLDRAEKAEEKLRYYEDKEKEKARKLEAFEKDFEKAIEDSEKEKKGGGEK